MATELLARTKLQNLDPRKLKDLILLEQGEGKVLLQSHYHVAGSLEEHLGAVRTAFLKWMRADDNGDYYYSYVLGVKANEIIFYRSNWSTDEYSYYTVGYTSGPGGIAIEGTPVQVDATIVINALGLTPDATDGDIDQSKKMAQDPNKTQDAVPVTTAVTDLALTPGGGHSDATHGEIPSQAETDATKAKTVVPTPTELEFGKRIEGTEGVGENDDADEGSGVLDTAWDKVEAGLKQSGKTYFQSKSIDRARGLSLGCITQSRTEEKEGKKHLYLTAIVTRGDIINSQGQVYKTSLWQKQLPLMNARAAAGKFVGQLEHQTSKGLTNIAVRYTKFWMQGADVCAELIVIPTIPDGLNLQAQVDAGVQVDFSTAGYGSSTKGKWQGQSVEIIDEDDFTCLRVDVVQNASSEGSTLLSAQYQSEHKDMDNTQAATQTQSAQDKVAILAAQANLIPARTQLLNQAASVLSPEGVTALKTILEKAGDAETLIQSNESALELLKAVFAKSDAVVLEQAKQVTYNPQFFVKQSQEEIAPQTPREMIQRLCADLPDKWPHNQGSYPAEVGVALHSPRATVTKIMENMAQSMYRGFNGPASIRALLALEQGKIDRAQNILDQSLATGSTVAGTNTDPGGAPLAAPLIFPLIRRVYPQYIAQEIASIQAMDRPDGKLFYLDTWRVVDGTDANDARQDINTSSSPFSSSFANDPGEGSAAALLRMELKSIAVRANNKKLRAQWSIEEMQDLRAYHGLDAAQELLGALAREMAIEWNLTVLNGMLANATASNRSFGTVMPATGFSQQEWDNYFWTYLQAVDNDIFIKRNGQATHVVMGVNAALAAGKGLKFVSDMNSDSQHQEVYPGTVFYPIMTTPSGARLRIIKTNLWTGANANKCLVIRRGGEWSDTPYIFAPYADYVTPQFTNPSDFSQQQGILSRAAVQTVVGDAMGVLTVNTGSQGVTI